MAHGDVPIHTHHCQREDAGEHVVVVDANHYLAETRAEGPRVQQHIGALEGKRCQHQEVCQGQVEDVYVGGSVHFRVPVGGKWYSALWRMTTFDE